MLGRVAKGKKRILRKYLHTHVHISTSNIFSQVSRDVWNNFPCNRDIASLGDFN